LRIENLNVILSILEQNFLFDVPLHLKIAEFVFFNYYYFEVHIVKIMPTSLFRRALIFFLFVELFRIWVNGFGPAGTMAPVLRTRLLNLRINEMDVVPS